MKWLSKPTASGTPLLWDELRALIQSVCRVVNPAEPDD